MKRLLILLILVTAGFGQWNYDYSQTPMEAKIWGNVAVSDTVPSYNFYDAQATDGDLNAQILVNADSIVSGDEDIDFSIYQQVEGTLSRTYFSDADQGIWLYPLGETANPVSITTGGDLNLPNDLLFDTAGEIQWNATDKLIHSANTMTLSGFTTWDHGAANVHLGDDLYTKYGASQDVLLGYNSTSDLGVYSGKNLNLSGQYLLNNQDAINDRARGTVLRFAGSADFVGSLGDPSLFGSTVGAISVKCTPNFGATMALFAYADDGTDNNRMILQIDGSGILGAHLITNATQWNLVGVSALTDGASVDVTLVQNGTSPALYVNGILYPTTISGADETAWIADIPTTDKTNIGMYEGSSNIYFFNGEIGEVILYNYALSAAQVLDMQSGNTPYAYQDGSQTALSSSTFTGSLDGWDALNTWNSQVNTGATAMTLTATASGQACRQGTNFLAGKIGREISVTYEASGVVGTPYLGYHNGANVFILPTLTSGSATLTNGTNTLSFIFGGAGWDAPANLNLYLVASANLDSVVIDNIIVTQLGEVAKYTSNSISAGTWYNTTANAGLDGAITTTEVLNYAGAHTDGTDLLVDNNIIGEGAFSIGESTNTNQLLFNVDGSSTFGGDISVPTKTPSGAGDTGVAGTITWDATYLYVCTATDTWQRMALGGW